MVFPLETTINYSCECYIHGSTFYLFFVLPKMEASNVESIFECISYGVNKVLVLVLVLVLVKIEVNTSFCIRSMLNWVPPSTARWPLT